MVTATEWITASLNDFTYCYACEHEGVTEGCSCDHAGCPCCQLRKPTPVMCFTCAYDPVADRADIYSIQGTGEIQYREQWLELIEEMHRRHDGAHEPNWHDA